MPENNIQIIKTSEYNPIKGRLSKYKSLDLVTTYRYSPGITDQGRKMIRQLSNKSYCRNLDVIIHSESLRTKETAQVIQGFNTNAQLIQTGSLNEIYFSLTELISRKRYEKEGSNRVRQLFIGCFEKNEIIESRHQINKRLEELCRLLSNKDLQKKKILCVSHSFFMKILQIFLQEPKLFSNPSILRKHFDPCQRTFEFLAGFSFTVNDLSKALAKT